MRVCRILLTLLVWLPAVAHAWSGTLISIHDGDTITAAPLDAVGSLIKIRLYGIDSPEQGQPGGADATAYLHSLLPLRANVEVTEMGKDKYGRTVALVEHEGRTVNELMVEAGHAWVYARYCRAAMCKGWYALQRNAAAERRGLWEEDMPIAPWLWRKAMREQ